MNKLIIALSVACASACVFADSNATITPYEKLELKQPADWFSVTPGESTPTYQACAKFGDGAITVEDGELVIESELATPVTITSAAAVQDITTVELRMTASTVPEENLVNLSGKGKVAFAISGEGDDRGFKAWLGGATWVSLSETAPVDETTYTLTVRFDSRSGVNKVRFEYGNVCLVDDSADANGWMLYANAPVAKALSIDLVGNGKVASITGKQIEIANEIIVIGDGEDIKIAEADKQAFEKGGADVATVLAESAKTKYAIANEINVATAYALGLIENKNGTMQKSSATLAIKANATAAVADAIPVEFQNAPTVNAASGATFTYQLFGSADGTSWEEVDGATSSQTGHSIPTAALTAGKRFFKMVTTVTFSTVNE